MLAVTENDFSEKLFQGLERAVNEGMMVPLRSGVYEAYDK